jgi:hypothetical protein
MRQVDDFAIAAPNERTSDILLDMIDEKLSIPLKRQGLLDMYNDRHPPNEGLHQNWRSFLHPEILLEI